MIFKELIQSRRNLGAWIVLIILVGVVLCAMFISRRIETDFNRVEVQQVQFKAANGKKIAAKLMIPKGVTKENPAPGLIYLHGYQNNKETSAPYCIEAARRGFVVLNMDTMGRGKSQAQIDANKIGFDPVYGGRDGWEYLLNLPFVDAENSGLMGHSLGAEMVYTIALSDTRERVLITSGFAWLDNATAENPQNMLMIFGKYDEYRERMSKTDNFELEWMSTPQVKKIILEPNPIFNKSYGSFKDGSARKVFMPAKTHVRESFDSASIAVAMEWIRDALNPDPAYWIDSRSQIWQVKEWCSLVALIAGIMTLIPLSLILIKLPLFQVLQNNKIFQYTSTRKDILKHGGINGVLMLLYLPLILVVFAIHIYIVRIDYIFPLMMVNGVVFWFLITNLVGYFLLKRWVKRGEERSLFIRDDLGLSAKKQRPKIILFSFLIFLFAYLLESITELIFGVDYRFIFPYASRLTPFRALLFLEYSILFFLGFSQMQKFLFSQLRLKESSHWVKSWIYDSVKGILLMIIPILIIIAVQYIPLFTVGTIPFVGPGASLIGFVMNLEHMVLLLSLIVPVGAWMYRLTGNTTTGAIVCSLLVSWFFCSSSVLAPVPI